VSASSILTEDPTTRNPLKQIVAVGAEHDVFVAGEYVGSRRFRHDAEVLAAEAADRYLRALAKMPTGEWAAHLAGCSVCREGHRAGFSFFPPCSVGAKIRAGAASVRNEPASVYQLCPTCGGIGLQGSDMVTPAEGLCTHCKGTGYVSSPLQAAPGDEDDTGETDPHDPDNERTPRAASWSSAPGGAKVRQEPNGRVTWINTSVLGGGAL